MSGVHNQNDVWDVTAMPEYPAMENAGRPPCILIVEDEVVIRFNIAEACRDSDLTVVEAANADEAWEYILAGGRPDLVFTDVAMPGSIDGLELCHRIQQHDPAIKLMITSGNLGLRKAPGGTVFLQKPYLISRVMDQILEHIEPEPAQNDAPSHE